MAVAIAEGEIFKCVAYFTYFTRCARFVAINYKQTVPLVSFPVGPTGINVPVKGFRNFICAPGSLQKIITGSFHELKNKKVY